MSQLVIDHKIEDVPVVLIFDHTPFEPQTLEDPGVDEAYDLEQVLVGGGVGGVGGVDIISLLDDCLVASLITDAETGKFRDDYGEYF